MLQAQAATGTISGRVFNPVSKEYVRNAEIRIQGTDITGVSGDNGTFTLSNVPAGDHTVVVSYAGYDNSTAAVTVRPGDVASAEINLRPAGAAGTTTNADGTVVLEQFVVSSDLEGNSKAIMQQRNSMNVGVSIASDVFGDVTEGNVGEFLKHLPGVELEYVEADTRGPRLGGMDPEYAGVAIDGMKLASADAFMQYAGTENGGAGTGNRSFGFEQVSINSIESIEINRVAGADMDADSPAGLINLRTKRAFDRKGRRITWQFGTTFNSEEFTLSKTYGPDDNRSHKFKPNGQIEFSDVYLNNRLGVLLGVSLSNLYNEQYRIDHSYSRVAGDPRPQVVTQLAYKDGPKWTERFTTTLTTDYKVSPDLYVGLTASFNGYDARFYNRTVTIASSRAANTGGDGLNTFNATSGGSVSTGGGSGFKFTNTVNVSPKFEYKRGAWVIDGAAAYSRSKNDYENIGRGSAFQNPVNGISNITFTGVRPDGDEAGWQVVQTGGPDWADLRNYTNPRIRDEGRYAFNEVWTGEVNAKFTTSWSLPTFFKAGVKYQERAYDYKNDQPIYQWSYIGPGGNVLTGFNAQGQPTITTTGNWGGYPTGFIYDMGATKATFRSISGGQSPAFPNRDDTAALFNTRPDYFVNIATPGDWETKLRNERRQTEIINSAYFQGNTRFKRLTVQAGLRLEETTVRSKMYDPLTNAEVQRAGFTLGAPIAVPGRPGVTVPGNPNTIPGMIYKYTAQPRRTVEGDYLRPFPSVTAKYRFSENLIFDAGYSKSIKRPNINQLTGIPEIQEQNLLVILPNPDLKPEYAEKFVASAGYYFGRSRSNMLTLTATQIDVQNLAITNDFLYSEFLNAEAFGFGDEFRDFEFRYSESGPGTRRFRSFEVDYRTQLNFLPRDFRGTNIFTNYTRAYADSRRNGLTPHKISGGFNIRFRRASLRASGVWLDDAPWNNANRYRKANVRYDLSGSFEVMRNVSVFFQGRNILNESHRIFEQVSGMAPVLWRLENYGANWSFGVRGNF